MHSAGPLILPTERRDIVLRQLWTPQDDEDYFNAVNSCPEHLSQFGESFAANCETVDAARRMREYAALSLRMGVRLLDENELVHGDCLGGTFVGSITARPDAKGSAELSYWVREDSTGKGIATAAARAMVSRLVACFYERIYAEVNKDNIASTRVLQKAGFVATRDAGDDCCIFEYRGHRS